MRLRNPQKQREYFARWYANPKNKRRQNERSRQWAKSHPKLSVKKRPSLEARFWSRVEKSDGCWIWRGSRIPQGYGRMVGDRYAHRFSWEIHFGEIPVGKFVCHSCDNPPCVNPAHLWIGDARANSQDRDRKGRGRYAQVRA